MNELKSALDISLEKAGKIEEKTGEKIVPLTKRQKEKIAELRKIYDAKIAEREIMKQSKIGKSESGNPAEVSVLIEELNKIFNEEKSSLLDELEKKIDKVRKKKN